MLPSRLKTRPNSLLKLSAMSLVVATLSGCGEDAKDCGGFWDKTFGREECAVNNVAAVTSIAVTPPVVKSNVVLIDDTFQSKLVTNYIEENAESDVLLTLDNSNKDFSNIKKEVLRQYRTCLKVN